MRPRPATWAASLVSAAPAGFTALAVKREVRKPHSRRSARLLPHLQAINPQTLDLQILPCCDCESGRRQSCFLGKDSLRRPQRPSFLKRAKAHF